MAKIFIALAALVAVCAAQVNPSVNCRNDDEPVADISDCSKFFNCFSNVATRMSCPKGLEFNPQLRYCDWPNSMPNPQCNRLSMSGVNGPCAGTTGVALIQHPNYCNAYMTCSNGYLNDNCMFCAVGSYFDTSSQRCVGALNFDLVCQNKRVVDFENQDVYRLDPTCFPSNPQIFAVLYAKIKAERGLRQ